jgi:uncharacterized protein
MIAVIITGFVIGIMGAFHCVGMCGPLALSLPFGNNSIGEKIYGVSIYNLGRIASYTLLGIIFGIIGQSVSLFGWQQMLSIIMGALIIVFMLLSKRTVNSLLLNKIGSSFFNKIRNGMSKMIHKRHRSSLVIIGLLNGLLPCGLVYLAIAGSVATGSIIKSALFMASFGAGTLPVMWTVAFMGNSIGAGIRRKIRSAYPVFMIIMGSILIVRGLGLNIPYVSPHLEIVTGKIHSCCQKH